MIIVGSVALFATVAWFLRNNLIEQISNPLLRKYGFTVTDVSLDALARHDASISYLKLVHEKGTTVVIEGLTLPLGTAATELKTYTAKKVSIETATRSDGAALELALLTGQLLSLPDNLDDSKILVGEFEFPPYPGMREIRWDIADAAQHLSVTVNSIALSVAITAVDASHHAVSLSLPSTPGDGRSIEASLQQNIDGFLLTGTSTIDLPAWEPLANLAGIVPSGIDLLSGAAALHFDIEIPNDVSQSPTLSADLAPSSPLQLTYTGNDGAVASISVRSGTPLAIAATFPEIDWSVKQDQSSLLVTYDEWRNLPVVVREVSCRTGPICSLETQLSVGAAKLPIGKVASMTFVSQQEVLFPDSGVLANIRPGATLTLTGLATADSRVGRIEGKLVSDATLELVDAGWRLAVDSLDTRIEALTVSDALSVAAPLFLENLRISMLDDVPSLNAGIFAPSLSATFGKHKIALPGLKGSISLQGEDAGAELKTVGLQKDASIKAQHNAATGTGRITTSDASISFDRQHLSRRIAPWPRGRDIVAGSVSFELDANWARKKSGPVMDARGSLTLSDLAGYYGGTAFAGLATRLNIAYRTTTGFVSDPSSITIALIESGLPLENLSADYKADLNTLSLDVQNLRMTAVGGVISADPFSYHTDSAVNTLTLNIEALDLTKLLSLKEFEAVEVSGSIGAKLPVRIEGDKVTIVNGVLTGNPPGGVIRYRSASPANGTDPSSIGFAKRVLSNFEYKTLTSDVSLSRDGDLNLKLQLTGRNPDLDEKRPVVLNLGVEDNVLQLLRSLKAARAVEDVLEKRLGR